MWHPEGLIRLIRLSGFWMRFKNAIALCPGDIGTPKVRFNKFKKWQNYPRLWQSVFHQSESHFQE